MPNKIYLVPDDFHTSGIDITWYKTKGEIHIAGWYDDFVGIQGERMPLGELFDRLGITLKDCERAFKNARTVE